MAGWEPTTFYQYDADGRLVSSTPEAEWTPEQQGWALALAEYEAGVCETCGHHLDETLPPASEPEDWRVLPPLRCSVCTILSVDQVDRAIENKDRPGGGHLHALRYRVVRKRRRRR